MDLLAVMEWLLIACLTLPWLLVYMGLHVGWHEATGGEPYDFRGRPAIVCNFLAGYGSKTGDVQGETRIERACVSLADSQQNKL